MVVVTRCGDFIDGFALFFGHEADDGENGETRKETGARIDRAHDQRLSEISKQKGMQSKSKPRPNLT